MNDNNSKPTILHGNQAKIDPKKKVIPVFENLIGDYKTDRYGRSYHRHDSDDYADFVKSEVDSIRL
jgi:hypothetical protein